MRGSTFGSLTLAVVLGLALPAVAAAGQWPHERDGIVLGFNVGGGSAGVTASSLDSDRETGFAGSGRVAYALDPQWALGLEGNVWTKEVDGESWTFSVGGVAATFYPGGGGFFVRGGVGSGRVEFTVDSGSFQLTASDTGFGFLLGAGYEWRLSRKFALGPEINYAYANIDDDFSLNYINTTVGLNWYF
jgi:opacity protein-like surface antigen